MQTLNQGEKRSIAEGGRFTAAQDLYGHTGCGTGCGLFHAYDFTFVGDSCSGSNSNYDVDLTVQFGLRLAEEEDSVSTDIANQTCMVLAISPE